MTLPYRYQVLPLALCFSCRVVVIACGVGFRSAYALFRSLVLVACCPRRRMLLLPLPSSEVVCLFRSVAPPLKFVAQSACRITNFFGEYYSGGSFPCRQSMQGCFASSYQTLQLSRWFFSVGFVCGGGLVVVDSVSVN